MDTDWVDRLTESLTSGVELDLCETQNCDPADADSWDEDRVVPAAALREVLVREHARVDPRGLEIRGARITGDLNLAHVAVGYPIVLRGCRFDGDVICEQATLKQVSFAESHLRWLHGEQVTIHGDLYLNKIHLTGGIILRSARIEGRLGVQYAELTAASYTRSYRRDDISAKFDTNKALDITGARIDSGLFALNLKCCGMIFAIGAEIGFRLQLDGAEVKYGSYSDSPMFPNFGHDVLILDGIRVAGAIAGSGMTCYGGIRLPGGRFGELDLSHVKIDKASTHYAVMLSRAEIGLVNLIRARIAGPVLAGMSKLDQIEVTNATLSSPGRAALHLDGATIRDGVYARSDCYIEGQVRAMGARVEGQFVLAGAEVINPGDIAVNLRDAQISQLVLAGDDTEGSATAAIDGLLDLSGAAIGDLSVPKQQCLPALVAPGWKLRDVHGQIRDDWRAARRWLRQTPEDRDAAQTWHELAAVYTRNGRPDQARRLSLAAADRVTKRSPLRTRLGRTLYGSVVGHGYAWGRVGFWLVLAIAIAAATAYLGRTQIVPTDPKSAAAAVVSHTETGYRTGDRVSAAMPCEAYPEYPCVNALGYGLAVMVPASAANPVGWTAIGWLAIALTVMKLFVWTLSALLLAGVTGLLRKT